MWRVQCRAVIHALYCRLATILWSLAIILPLYYSTILTSTYATGSTDIPSYEAIQWRMCLHYYRSYNLRYILHTRFLELPFPMRYDTRSPHYNIQIWQHWLISEVSWYIYPIEVNHCRDNCELCPGQPARRHVSNLVSCSQLQRIHHTWTRMLSNAASMIIDKLPSNWVDWWLQGWWQSPYVHKSCTTGNARAGHSSEAVYKLRAIHVNSHRWRQLKSRSPSTRLDGVSCVKEAAKKHKRVDNETEMNLQRICVDFCNPH